MASHLSCRCLKKALKGGEKMDMNTNVMSAAPADVSTVKPVTDKASSVQSKTPAKDRRSDASGKKDKAADKFDAVLEKTQEDKSADDANEKKVPEAKEQPSTPLAAELAVAVALQAKAEPQQAETKAEPLGSKDTELKNAETNPNGQAFQQMAAGFLASATLNPSADLTTNNGLTKSLKDGSGKTADTAKTAAPVTTNNLSIESLLSQNKSLDKNPQTILELLNAKASASSKTDSSVQVPTMTAALQASTDVIGQMANQSTQVAAESTQAVMQQLMPQTIASVQGKNSGKTSDVNKNALDKNNKASDSLAKTSSFSLTDSSLNPLQGVPLKTENQTPMTPLQQQLQNMQQAAKPVEEASTADTGANLLKSDEPAKASNETDTSEQHTSQFMTQLSKASDVSNTLGIEQTKPVVKDYEIPKQIVEQAKLIKTTENSQMVIKLSPEHLGEMVLKVSVSSNGSVNASFHSDNAEVRTIIENSLVQLRQELQAQGLKVDNVGVYAGLGDSLGQGSQANQQQQAGSQNKHRQVNMADFEDEVSSIAPVNTDVTADDGIDYRI
jgi:flagellar hook-length control protein FliK